MDKSLLPLILVALGILFGCKKEDQPDSGRQGSKRLKQWTKTQNGIMTTYRFSYDHQDRLVSIRNSTNTEVTTFTYDNSGNVSKVEEDNTIVGVRGISEFTYNSGVPATGTFKRYELAGGQIGNLDLKYDLTYTVANSRVTAIKLFMIDYTEEEIEINYNLAYDGENLVRIEADGPAPFTVTFTYGTNKPVFPVVFTYALNPGKFFANFFAKNEQLTELLDRPGTSQDRNVTSQYTYDAEGFVLTAQTGSMHSLYEYE